MTVEIWGLGGTFNIGFPLRISGDILLGVECLAFILLILSYRRTVKPGYWGENSWHRPLLLVLILLAPFASQTILVRLPLRGVVVIPGTSFESEGPAFSIFGSLPWMLAGGLLGQWQAVLVGLVGGLARCGWETHRILTPLHMAFQASLVAWLMRRDYAEWPGHAARNLLISGSIGGLFLGLLQGVEYFAFSGGSIYDGVDYAFSLLGPTIVASVIEAGFAGAVCEIVRLSEAGAWYRPQQLSVGPYNRSLVARLLTLFVIVWGVASGVLLYGDWLLAQSSARDLVERQMKHTAIQAGDSIPFFIQTGRSYISRIVDRISPIMIDEAIPSEVLATWLRSEAFFNQIAIFDVESQIVVSYPHEENLRFEIPYELEVGLSGALNGVPEEVIIEPLLESQAAEIAFLWPIPSDEEGRTVGVLVGWTDLISNPLLSPVVASLENVFPGEAFLTDGRGIILIHSSPDQVMQKFDFDTPSIGEVHVDTAPDGTRRLVYAYSLDGYPWYMVVTTPMREVQQQAFQIATRLMGVIAFVGSVVIALVYVFSRRLTQPLRMMANVAQSIAQGDLAQPIEVTGEDEIGRLAVSFERMRRGLKVRLDEMALLLTVSHHVATSFELSQVLPPILEGITNVIGADFARLALVLMAGEQLQSSEAYQSGEDPGNWSAIDPQVISLCNERGRFTLENPLRAKAVIDFQALAVPIESLTALPIKHEGEFIGVFWLGFRHPRIFASEEINLLSILASQLGVAIANARLYQRAEQERMRLMAVLEGTPDAVIVVDRDGLISLVNPATANLLRGEIKDAVGKHVEEWLTTPALIELLLASDQEVQTAEVEIGRGQVMFASISEIKSGGDKVTGRVCVLRDITHYKKLDSLKSEFVSTVSHDLRAPLTLLRGYATMLSMVGEMNEQQHDFMGKILASVDQMDELVDNLLDLGRIEAGMGLNLKSTHINDVILEVIKTLRPQAVSKQIKLEEDLTKEMEPIEVDPTLLRQALTNIIDNAIRYTPAEGRVTVRAYQRDKQQLISVQDTGVGIAPTDQVRLFEKFYRIHRQEELSDGGLGLGLAIAKSVVEQHGGRISVESRLGEGSTFTIEIPIRISSGEHEKQA
jgi:PAS domain S-box-containing protein